MRSGLWTRRKRLPRASGEDEDEAASIHGERVDRGMVLHYWVSAPGPLERGPRGSALAVLS